ncbi:MAG: hypothetical protein V7607_5683 [Solirubrobacteraceae bacterium]
MNAQGQVALVTGAASGLGAATARRLVAAGAQVVLADLESSGGQATARGLGERAAFHPTDVTSEEDVLDAVDCASAIGPLRILVSCAGIAPPGRVLRSAGPLSLEAFARTVEVNLGGTFNVVRLGAAAMGASEPIDDERGVIVCTASIAAYDGQIGQAANAASKAGVAGMTLPLARDLAEHLIRVVTIAPGIFETPMLAGLPEPVRRSLGDQVPHPRRLGHPDEFAALVEHIVTNPMLNGETIRLDGAIRMAPR